MSLLSDLKFALTHLATIRKAILAAATSVASDIAVLNTFVHLPGQLGVILTAVQGVAVFLVTFLSPNQSTESAKAADRARAGKPPLTVV